MIHDLFESLFCYYPRSKTELAGALHVGAIWDLHYQLKRLNHGLWWCQGATGRRQLAVVVLQQNKFPKKVGIFIELDPEKALFRGVGDLISVPIKGKLALEETPGYLRGSIVHAYMPRYLPSCGRKCDTVRKKTPKLPIRP